MRLGTLTLSATLSAALLSGCSFINGQPGQFKNPFAKQKAAQSGQYGYNQASAAQHCQIATPRQPIPRGCRPEQVTIGVNPQAPGYGGQNYGTNGFPQQPQFGQPQYTNGAYGSAVGQAQSAAYHAPGSRKRKPQLRGSLSLGVEKSIGGALLDFGARSDLAGSLYNPQLFNQTIVDGSTTTTYTANQLDAVDIYAPNQFDNISGTQTISFDDVWSTPAQIKAGAEYILNESTTVFANGGYTYAEGRSGSGPAVNATIYRQEDTAGVTEITERLDQRILSTSYDFSDLRQYDLEVGARRYFNPVIKSEGYRTVTPFVGASVGVSHVNAVDVKVTSEQANYRRTFEGLQGSTVTSNENARLYDAQWLPQGQLNVGAEWQVTPGFAIAAETGLKIQGAREYADFTNAAGETISGAKGDANISVPVTLRGSINF